MPRSGSGNFVFTCDSISSTLLVPFEAGATFNVSVIVPLFPVCRTAATTFQARRTIRDRRAVVDLNDGFLEHRHLLLLGCVRGRTGLDTPGELLAHLVELDGARLLVGERRRRNFMLALPYGLPAAFWAFSSSMATSAP